MKSKQRLAILVIAIAALMTLLAVVPAFGADATQRFPNASDTTKVDSWSRQGTTITSTTPFIIIEVSDADLDAGTSKVFTGFVQGSNWTAGVQRSVSTLTGTSSLGVTSTAGIVSPILDNNGDGFVIFSDVVSSNANIKVVSVDGLNGTVLLEATGTVNVNTSFTLSYKAGAVDNTASGTGVGSVKVTSDADATGINVILEETSAQSGIFRGYLKLVSANSTTTRTCLSENSGTTCTSSAGGSVAKGSLTSTATTLVTGDVAKGEWTVGSLKVNANDSVVFAVVDAATTRTASIKVETTPPAYGNLEPVDGSATTNNLPTAKGDVTDGDSAVDSTTVQIVFGIDTDGDGDLEVLNTTSVVSNDINAITGGFNFEQRLPSGLTTADDFVVYWWVRTTDVAGNVGVSDLKPIIAGVADACTASLFSLVINSTIVTTDSDAALGGCQPYSIRVDRSPPTLSTAVTGSFWDTASLNTDKTVTLTTAANVNFIRVDFDAAIDTGTVARTDFKVAGVTPLNALTFAGRPQTVFLEVTPLDPSDRPKVEVAGSIKDLAGNELKTASIAAAVDGIAPTLTLTSGTVARSVTNGAASLTLTSNENASTATVVLRVGQITDNTKVNAPATNVPPSGGPTVWTGSITPATAGLYNVFAQATDLNVTTNTGSAGVDESAAVTIDLTKAVLFEVDKGIPTPSFIPASTTDESSPVVSINFVDEGKEYGLNSSGIHVTGASTIVTNFDTHGTVTVTSASLDGTDISAALSSADSIRFLFKASDLTIGNHVVKIKVKDEAGNEVEFTNTFAVTARTSASIPLVPGWNQISFPGDPADSSVDAVIGTVPVTVIMAFDPTNPALWLIATRDSSTASFSGTLTNIRSGWGYWVFTDTFEPITTLIPRIAGGAAGGATPVTPPTLNLVKGWNLVPVLDVTGNKTAADASDVAPATYFGSVTTITRVYWFDTLNNSWVVVTHGATATSGTDDKVRVKIGRAYWVYTTAAATLTP